MQVHKELELTRREPVLRYNYRFDLKKIKTNILNSTIASVMIFSSIAGTLPMLLTQKAFATAASYTQAPFTTSELNNWSPDRHAPSGGQSIAPFGGRTDVLNIKVDNTKASTAAPFYQTEGLQRIIPPSDTIKADLYVDGAWATNHVRAGLWGVAKDSSNAISAYPIIEFTSNNNGFTGWRTWDGVNGGWTNLLTAAHAANSWYTLEISLNHVTHQFNVFINGTLVTLNAGDVSTSIGAVILNDYNYATTTADDYSVNWSNFSFGNYVPVVPTVTTVSGDTSAAQNLPGWMFNRDTTTATPYNFTTAQHSTGIGSLFVKPISGVNPKDKFIGESFAQIPVSDLNSISYDYLIAGNGTASSANQFYLNVYANIDNSNNYYDCRFDYVPTTGSTTNFTKASFATTDTPVNVQQRANSRTTCPTTLAGMPAGSHVRMASISVGDTSASDTGLAGYLDNFVVNKISGVTAYDFEPVLLAAPTNLVPANNAYTSNTSFDNTWSPVTGAVKYEYTADYTLNGEAKTYTDTSDSGNYVLGATLITRHNNGAPQSTYSWKVRAIDAQGNAGIWSAINKVTVDTTAPATPTLLTPPNNGFVGTNDFNFTWTAATDTSPITYEFQSSQNPAQSGGVLTTGVWNNIASGNAEQSNLTTPQIHSIGAPDGNWYWQVRAIDAAGNKSAWTPVWKATIDSSGPIASITSPVANQYVKGRSIAISGTATDTNFNYYYCYVTNASGEVGTRDAQCQTAWAVGTPFVTSFAATTFGQPNGLLGHVTLPNSLADGNYEAHLVVKDKAGNTTEATQPFFLDNSAPVVDDTFNVSYRVGDRLTLAPKVTGESDVTYLWRVSDSKLAIVNDPTASMTGPTLTLGPSPKGDYTVTLTVTDKAGNSTPVIYYVSVTLPPTAAPQATKPRVSQASPVTVNPAPAAAVTVANVTTPQVLGATTTEPDNAGEVKGAATTAPSTANLTTTNTATAKTANFLGLGWWWLAVVGAIVGFGLLFSRYLGTDKKA